MLQKSLQSIAVEWHSGQFSALYAYASTQTILQPTLSRELAVDSGEYSDYSLIGFFTVLRDFCLQDLLDEYLMQKPNEYFNEDEFLAFLLAEGYLLEIEYDHLHLGGISEF